MRQPYICPAPCMRRRKSAPRPRSPCRTAQAGGSTPPAFSVSSGRIAPERERLPPAQCPFPAFPAQTHDNLCRDQVDARRHAADEMPIPSCDRCADLPFQPRDNLCLPFPVAAPRKIFRPRAGKAAGLCNLLSLLIRLSVIPNMPSDFFRRILHDGHCIFSVSAT